jgi:hypothetical protein
VTKEELIKKIGQEQFDILVEREKQAAENTIKVLMKKYNISEFEATTYVIEALKQEMTPACRAQYDKKALEEAH